MMVVMVMVMMVVMVMVMKVVMVMVMMVEMVMLTVMMILMKRPKEQGPSRPPGPPGATYTAVKIPAANGSGRPSEAHL